LSCLTRFLEYCTAPALLCQDIDRRCCTTVRLHVHCTYCQLHMRTTGHSTVCSEKKHPLTFPSTCCWKMTILIQNFQGIFKINCVFHRRRNEIFIATRDVIFARFQVMSFTAKDRNLSKCLRVSKGYGATRLYKMLSDRDNGTLIERKL